jgi:hypothetical protein
MTATAPDGTPLAPTDADELLLAPSDADELLLWALMARFERLALDRYAALSPALSAAGDGAKRAWVARLDALPTDPAALAASPLAPPTDVLLARAQSTDETAVLLVQGLVLEHLGQAIYRTAQATERASAATRALAGEGLAASRQVTAVAGRRTADVVGSGEDLYRTFTDRTHDVLGALDALADPVDAVFGERFGLRFADVMGEFVADLIAAGTALGMQRRKIVAHLAGACMGL